MQYNSLCAYNNAVKSAIGNFLIFMHEHGISGYPALMERYDKAQSAQKVGRETKLEHLEAAETKLN